MNEQPTKEEVEKEKKVMAQKELETSKPKDDDDDVGDGNIDQGALNAMSYLQTK